ncbi:histidine phosphatase family protein [Marivita sp. XM-24bin2]|uniref:SixA phosphatase family protein n=1 Tax=unclassified Marivita TaxID=2632480 RepID=UPI000D7A930F|nr:MAG: phosphoglycerate mutase [Marivita sp. XM-24bin2]
MRHAKSDWSTSGDDHSRPLNKRGRQSAPAMGRWLKRSGWLPDEVLCSTATRTRQTLDLLELPSLPTRFERGLYLADNDQILDALRTASAQTVLLLGHNYGIAECAHELVVRWPDHPRFEDYPTCATSLIEFDFSDWEEIEKNLGRCVDFTVPREILATEQEH